MLGTKDKKLIDEMDNVMKNKKGEDLKMAGGTMILDRVINHEKAEGRRLGRKEGRELGHTEAMVEVAIDLLKEKMSISKISKITGLSIEEIEKLKDK